MEIELKINKLRQKTNKKSKWERKMTKLKPILLSTVVALATSVTALPVLAETPDNMLVIATRIDDVTTLDPAQSFEFSGSDIIRKFTANW